jgi:hypothetical protein
VKDAGEAPERGLEDVVSRALRDNLTPLQRTADDLHQACADFVAACGSAKPSNALPALLRAQTAASSLASSLSVLSNFLVVAIKPAERPAFLAEAAAVADAGEKVPVAAEAAPAYDVVNTQEAPSEWAEEAPQAPVQPVDLPVESKAVSYTEELALEPEAEVHQSQAEAFEQPAIHEAVHEPTAASEPAFDLTSFPADIQELHRRANRVAKVAMQDIKLLRPKDVQMGREHKDICERLRSELDKARKEYDRRFRAIQDHPVDYFHRWMVEILAEGNVEALGEYPYPSPVLRH